MTFTDDDLAVVAKAAENGELRLPEFFKALLHRLEKAEQIVEECIPADHLKTCPLCEEWRKSAGREG